MSEEQAETKTVYALNVSIDANGQTEAGCWGVFEDAQDARNRLFESEEAKQVEWWEEVAEDSWDGKIETVKDFSEFMAQVVPMELVLAKGAVEPDPRDEELAKLNEKLLYAVAENENIKKRMSRDLEQGHTRTLQKVLSDILPVADNLHRALESMDEGAESTKGVLMVLASMETALLKHGLECIPTVGQPFDPSLHEALQQVDSPEHQPGTIIQEFERGYLRNGKLFRAARVIVAGPGSGADLEG